MDKITLPELPMLPNPAWSGHEIAFQCHEYAQEYARACCKHVLELAAKECENMTTEHTSDEWINGYHCCMKENAAIVRDLIGKL